MPRGVEIVARTKERQVRLGRVVKIEAHRTLHTDNRRLPHLQNKRSGRAIDRGVVTWPDRHHRDALTVDELDAILSAKDPGLLHPLVIVHGETPSRNRECHGYRAILAR